MRVAIVTCLACATLAGQQPGLQFEVASVRPMKAPSPEFAAGFRAGAAGNPCGGGQLSISGSRVSLTGAGICDIVRIAYDVKSYQVLGVPTSLGFSGQDKIAPVSMQASIAEADHAPVIFYDIEARAPGSDPPAPAQLQEMFRALLADRFHLTLHRETRDFSFYALVPAKNGPNLKPAVDGCKRHAGPDQVSACGQTMEGLAKSLSHQADRTVLDKTGISGKFDWEFPIERGDNDYQAAVRASLLEHLKLKLEPQKGPLEVLRIDHVERPTEN